MPVLVRTLVLLSLVTASTCLLGQERKDSRPSALSDEAVIRSNVLAFVKAFNAGDTKAIGKLFAAEAQLIDENGNTTQGRAAIEKTFAQIFADAPQARMQAKIDSIRLIGSALAIETGTTTVTRKPGETADADRYTVVHVKSRSGQWLMGFVRDAQEAELANSERLKPLDWMIGDWIDESHESIVLTSCKWAANKNFILQEIKVRMQGRDAMDLSQRIGWDPLTKQIKSWIFDSDGGYGESTWTRDGDRWLVKATRVRRDGTTASATNTFTPTGKDSYTWRSTDRILGGEILPPLEIKVVRKPPEPALSR